MLGGEDELVDLCSRLVFLRAEHSEEISELELHHQWQIDELYVEYDTTEKEVAELSEKFLDQQEIKWKKE